MLKLVCLAFVICGATCTDYTGYHGLPNVYETAYAPYYNNYKPKDYKFEYGVSDPYTGDHKSQWETKENGVVRGAYSLLEPDGTTRVVEYIADDGGFRAVVKKIGAAIHPSPAFVQPAALSHITSLYDHSSGVYGGTKENYIAEYQPQPIAYQDNSVHSAIAHGNADDEVRIFFNDQGIAHNQGALGYQAEAIPQYVEPQYIAQKPQIVAVQPEVNYIAPQQHQIIAAPEQYIASKGHQIIAEPQQYIAPREHHIIAAPEQYIAPREHQIIAAPEQYIATKGHQIIAEPQQYIAPREQIIAAPPQYIASKEHQILSTPQQYIEPEVRYIAEKQPQYIAPVHEQPQVNQYVQQEIQQHIPVPQQAIVQQYYQEPIQRQVKAQNIQLQPIPYKALGHNNPQADYNYDSY